jgi:ADP-ribose pyrophosphatase YjhB (NUDIX family)
VDISAGGHVEVGQTYQDAAETELRQELGMSVPLQDLGRFDVSDDRGNCIHHLFIGNIGSGELVSPRGSEHDESKIIDLRDLHAALFTDPSEYAEPFKRAVEYYSKQVRS